MLIGLLASMILTSCSQDKKMAAYNLWKLGSFAYDADAGKWLIHDHRVLRGIAVAVNPAPTLQADAVQPSLSIVPASAATTPVQ